MLDNPTAAQKLVDDTEKAILERLNFAESFEPYPSTKQREYPYYRIYVHNCTVFYVVIDGVMEVRRFLYSAQDIPQCYKTTNKPYALCGICRAGHFMFQEVES